MVLRHLAALIALGGLTACATKDPEHESVGKIAAVHHELDVDWVHFSEGQIYLASNAIVAVRVLSQELGSHRTYPFDPERGRVLRPEEAGDEYAEMPLTTSIVEVTEDLFVRDRASTHEGLPIAAGARLKVVQLGGRYEDGSEGFPNDQPILAVGDELVLYLRPAGMLPDSSAERGPVYSVIGGQQGMVPVRAGMIEPLPGTVFERAAHQPRLEFTTRVRELATDLIAGAAPPTLELMSPYECGAQNAAAPEASAAPERRGGGQ